MRVFRSLDEIAGEQPSVATIGAFDGVHLAHQALLRRVCEQARAERARSVAITFDPHPVAVLSPAHAPQLLTPLPVKLQLLEQTGIENLLILPFTEELSRWTAERFVEQVLVKALRVTRVIVGENFRFGHAQSGTPQLLQEMGARLCFLAEVLPSLRLRGWTVSSSQIRSLLEEGRVATANRLLGRPFSIRGEVVPGLGIGRSQTVPTLNLGPYAGLIPAQGVYVTTARLGSGGSQDPLPQSLSHSLRSVSNVGLRPTFGPRELGVETHLLDAWPGPPPSLLEIGFLHRLRDERRFDSAEALKAQIGRDISGAQSYFRRVRSWVDDAGQQASRAASSGA